MGRSIGSVLLVAIAACSPFHGTDGAAGTTTGTDGGTEAGTAPIVTTDVTVTIDWPTNDALNPLKDSRASQVRVVLTDAADATHRVEQPGATSPGPFTFARFASSGVVIATIEIAGKDARLIGFGKATADVRASGDVKVLARRRLLYFTSNDRLNADGKNMGTLRAFDMADGAVAEGVLAEWGTPLPSLVSPTALQITGDGAFVVQAGGGGTTSTLSVVDTGTHAQRSIALPQLVSRLVVLENHRLLAMPSKATTLVQVDLDTSTVTQLPTAFQGGGMVVKDAARSADGTHLAAVALYDDGATGPRQVLMRLDLRDPSAKLEEVVLGSKPAGLGGVRFTPDGKSMLVSVYRASGDGGNDWTGELLSVDVATGKETSIVTSKPMVSKLASLLLDPTGRFAFASSETIYAGTTSCCGGLHVFALAPTATELFTATDGASGPTYDVASAVALPYGANRVIGGQSDSGNNIDATDFVDLSSPTITGPPKINLAAGTADIGSVQDLLTPFGAQL